MATAPTPGSGKSKRLGLRITIDGDTRDLYLADLGPADDLRARKECGLPVTQFVSEERFGLDSLAVLWWTARRKTGEPKLKFSEVVKRFPNQVEMAEMMDEDRFTIEEIGADDEEGDEGPLPSAEA